jgi:hypothetical protein
VLVVALVRASFNLQSSAVRGCFTVVHTPHDRFAKEYAKGLLAEFGAVETEREVIGQVRRIDLVFFPDPTSLEALPGLGLLGRILSGPCGLEFFRQAVPQSEIINCRDKGTTLRAELKHLAKQRDEQLRLADLPMLWIFSPTLSERLQRQACMENRPDWGPGIYFLPKPDRTAIVAIHQLPETLDTLWVRLLGKGKVQANAVKDVLALPEDHPCRSSTLQRLSDLQVNLRMQQNRKTRELREVVMSLTPAYEKWEAEKIAEGQKIGEKSGKKLGKREQSLQIASRLLKKRMAIAEIAELTDLTIEQVQELQDL